MAENIFNPTAANILSSLKIKGATAVGGPGKDGYVPILGEDGKLDLSIVPVDTIQSLLDVPALKSVAFVDGKTEMAVQTGSIAAPFSTLASAAAAPVDASSSGDSGPVDRYLDFVLMPGDYGSENVGVASGPRKRVRIFGLGSAKFDTLTFNGYSTDTVFELYNVSVSSGLRFGNNVSASVILAGKSDVSVLSVDSDPEASLTVYVGADCSLNEDNLSGDVTVEYLADADRIAKGVDAPGKTVADVLDNLASRKIRYPTFTPGANGIARSTSTASISYFDEAYSLELLGTSLVAAVNQTFHKNGDSPTYVNVTASSVSANSVTTASMATDQLKLKIGITEKAILKVSADNFLEIA